MGQREFAGRALQKSRFQLRLQLLDPSADGVGRHAQAPGGFGEAAAADHLDEQRNIVEIEHGAHIPSFYG
ncbi:hypothetical protein D3C78_1708920 [compost metagenome]